MNIDKNLQEKIQELQLIEQQLQSFLLQKQAFQLELSEAESALEETEKSEGEIYRIISQIMLKAKKEDITKELKEKIKIFEFRIKAIEKQELIIQKKSE